MVTLGRVQQQVLGDLSMANGERQSARDLADQWPGTTLSSVHGALNSLWGRALVEPAGWQRGRYGRDERTWELTAKGWSVAELLVRSEGDDGDG